jgi:DNA primase
MKKWIDFKQLRAKLNFEQILRHYGVEMNRKGNQHHGFCPLPNHKGVKNSPSFSASLDRGIFQCFGCGGKGNILDFAALMENADPKNGAALRKVAAKLQQQFCREENNESEKTTVANIPKAEKADDGKQSAEKLPVMVNAQLDFELKGLDPKHPYLLNRGFIRETLEYFGIGYCSRGFLKGRVAIPLIDEAGKLIGYAGRVVDDASITEENPRYKFPSKRERNGTTYEFRKTLFLYNGFRNQAPMDNLIVVEGFTSVWWLHQSGIQNVVALMGADCSDWQIDLITAIVSPTGHIWLMPDGDEAGNRCAHSILIRLSPQRFVRWVKLEAEKQPTDYQPSDLKAMIG